jgi:hypothetical protein
MKEKINIELDIKTKEKTNEQCSRKKYVFGRIFEAVY